MRLNPPKQISWKIGVAIGVLGIIGHIVSYFAFPLVVECASCLLVTGGFVLLALSTALTGL